MERGYAVWGLDFAEPMIRQARELCGSDHFGVGDIEHMPFPDNSFDVVISLAVVEYLESDEQALREIRRVLRPGGRAVIAISNGRSPLLRLDRALLRMIAVLQPAYHLVRYRCRGRPAPSPGTPLEVAIAAFTAGSTAADGCGVYAASTSNRRTGSATAGDGSEARFVI